ncbi:formamidase [Marinococcus halophilus]|uniref:formamidase n=1 Tax=Marinococcus halophilus TaxID=1371 RepID=UPI0009A59409|nr:formamidase [Marinococcus halophilus]
MNGLGGLNKTPNGVVVGLVQLDLPTIHSKEDLQQQTQKVCDMMEKAKQFIAPIDLVVFPEYMLHGLSMDTSKELMCSVDGPEVQQLQESCRRTNQWACFSIMEVNPDGNPYNTGLIIDNHGVIQLHYRKLHPWVPAEPWEPGDTGLPVCQGPNGSVLGLAICHDGMFPEVSRELAYKGANVILRTAGYTPPIQQSWEITNRANAFTNLAFTASVAMCGTDGVNDSMGDAMIVDFEGTVTTQGGNRADEIITGEIRPDLAQEARVHWGVENNIYQLGHRGYVAVEQGVTDAPYTYMNDLKNGTYRLPWENDVQHTDGSRYGFPSPRSY